MRKSNNLRLVRWSLNVLYEWRWGGVLCDHSDGDEKIAELYDALIKSEREKIALLEKLMEKMNEKK